MACPTDAIANMARQPDGFWQQGLYELPDFKKSFWWNILPKGDYPIGAGAAPRKEFANRYLGDEFNVWGPVQPSNGTGSVADNAAAFLPADTPAQHACCAPVVRLAQGFSAQNFLAFQLIVDSEPICQTDLLMAKDPEQMVDMRVRQYGQQQVRIQASKTRNEWIRNNSRKIYLTPGPGIGGMQEDDTIGDPNATTLEAYIGLNNSYFPVSPLTQPILDFISNDFAFQNIPGINMTDGAPNYALVSDGFTLQNLVRQDSNVREDVRFADMGEGNNARLLNGINVQRAFRGFAHIQDLGMGFTRVADPGDSWTTTYNSGTGVWTPVTTGGYWKQVPPMINVPQLSGYTQERNPAFDTSPYRISVVYTDEVLEESVPPVIDIDSPYRVERLTDWVGTMKFLALNTVDDPLALQGRFYGHMIRGFQPMYNAHGATIIHLNCNFIPLRDCLGYAYGS